MPLHVSRTCAHHQEVKIALHSFWYHHTYRCDDTRGCVMQFWPPDDEHTSSKHVEAWNKLIVKQTFCASSWLTTEINILRCTVSKTSTNHVLCYHQRSLKTSHSYRTHPSLKIRKQGSLEKLGSDNPVKQRHIPDGWNPQSLLDFL